MQRLRYFDRGESRTKSGAREGPALLICLFF